VLILGSSDFKPKAKLDGYVDDTHGRGFLMDRMYRHWRVNRTRSQARRILAEMFRLFMAEPEVLPTEWRLRAEPRDEAGRARVVCDYIAGMTDRFAIARHEELVGPVHLPDRF